MDEKKKWYHSNSWLTFSLEWWKRPSRDELEAEVTRLTEKCRERSNECYLLKVKLDALQGQIEQAQRDYRQIRQDETSKILEGKDPAAVHEARTAYENNRLRIFVTTTFRLAQELQNEVTRLNKDLERSKSAVLGGMMPPAPPG